MESSLNRAIKAVVVLVLLCQAAAGQLVMAGVASDGSVDKWVLSTSLAQLGYPAGVVFADNTLPQRYSLLFPLPRDVKPSEATLHLYYRATPPLGAGASLALSINDKPAGELAVVADGATHEWVVPLSRGELQAGQLQLTLVGAFPLSAESCSGGLSQSGRLRVLPASYLQSSTQEQPATLRDLWLTLPREVKVSLPAGELDEATFSAAVEWHALLRRHHRTVRIVRMPERADVILAPRAVLENLLAGQSQSDEEAELWSGEANVGVIVQGSKRSIVVTTPYPSVERFAAEWPELKGIALVGYESPAHGALPDQVALPAFDIDAGQVPFRGMLQWHGTITPAKLPPGTQPVTALLDMQLPSVGEGESLRYYVYLNDRLVVSEKLAVTSERQRIEVPIKESREDNTYRMRITLRNAAGGDCISKASTLQAGIGSASYLEVRRDERAVAQLAALPTAYGHGFDLLLPEVALAEAERYLPLLAELLNGLALAPFDYKMVFYNERKTIIPTRNFMLVGSELPLPMKVPLQFERGRVVLEDRQGNLLLGDVELRNLAVLQLARYDGHSGVWLRPGVQNGLPAIDAGMLGSGNVALYANTHKILSLDTQQAGMLHIRYLDKPHWFERMHELRWIWLLVAWSLLTLTMIYLYRKAKQHRKA